MINYCEDMYCTLLLWKNTKMIMDMILRLYWNHVDSILNVLIFKLYKFKKEFCILQLIKLSDVTMSLYTSF